MQPSTSIRSSSDLSSRLTEITNNLLVSKGKRDSIRESIESLQKDIASANKDVNSLILIETYLSKFADERQAQVYRQIETVVSEGLRYVFQEDMQLEVSSKLVGSRSEVVFNLVSENEEGTLRTGIMDSRGGGVAAIVGFLVQVVLVLLTPALRPIIFLDEAFKNVSDEYQAPLGEFISDLCDRTGLQVVLVTHQPAIAETSDKRYAFSQVNGKTVIKEVTE